MKKRIFALALAGLAISQAALAQQDNPAPDLFVSFRNNDFGSVLAAVTVSILGIVGIVAVLYIIWGGFMFLTSGANPDLAKRGLSTLRNAIIGLIIVILSYIIVTVVVNSFGAVS